MKQIRDKTGSKRLIFTLLMCMAVLMTVRFGTVHTQAASTGKWVGSGASLKYLKSNNVYANRGFKRIKGYWYYFKPDGHLATGFQTINGRTFYFHQKGQPGIYGRMIVGWKQLGGKKYYFRKTGKKGEIGALYRSEFVTINGKTYYFKQDGSLFTGRIMNQTEFIDTVGRLAREDMKKTGILASVTTAQAILESGYGTSSLAIEANNLFGMKAMLSGNTWKSSWKGTVFQKQTLEYLNNKWYTITDTFRAYNSIAESLQDHSNYLAYAMNGSQLRYKGVVGNKKYRKTVKIIKKGGYATDPQYVSKICNIIKKYNLTKYDK